MGMGRSGWESGYLFGLPLVTRPGGDWLFLSWAHLGFRYWAGEMQDGGGDGGGICALHQGIRDGLD